MPQCLEKIVIFPIVSKEDLEHLLRRLKCKLKNGHESVL